MKKTDKNAHLVKSYNELYKDYKTKKQWLKLGYNIKDNATGVKLYTNGMCQDWKIYFSPNEVINEVK